MKKLIYALCLCAVLYLSWHCFIFSANADYRDRMNDADYIAGRTTKTYYSTRIF